HARPRGLLPARGRGGLPGRGGTDVVRAGPGGHGAVRRGGPDLRGQRPLERGRRVPRHRGGARAERRPRPRGLPEGRRELRSRHARSVRGHPLSLAVLSNSMVRDVKMTQESSIADGRGPRAAGAVLAVAVAASLVVGGATCTPKGPPPPKAPAPLA